MKRPISIKLDERVWVHIKDKPNRSRYIEELIKQDIHQAQIKPIVQSVSDELLSSEAFFNGISVRLNIIPPKSPTPSPSKGLSELSSTDYPCCRKPAPCKHWAFDENAGGWKNILNGIVRNE